MIETLDPDKFFELCKKLPVDLQDAISAPETLEKIRGICERNKIKELQTFMINKVLDVYLGVLSPNDFFAALKSELKGKTGIRQIVLEINNFLLFPYKDSIEKVYHLQAVPAAAAVAAAPAQPVAPVVANPPAPNPPAI